MTAVTSYTELIGAIREKVGRLGLKYEDFDDLVGLPVRFSGKALGPSHVRKFNLENVFDVLEAAGLSMKVDDDPECEERMRKRIAEKYNPRQANQARPNNHASAISSHVLSRAFGHILRKARKKRWAGKSKAERSAHASAIANVRWKKVRKRRRVAQQRRAKHRLVAVDTMCAG